MSQDHHKKPYDKETLTKLNIFEKYVEYWLPTFIENESIRKINIVDFFAGPGCDISGEDGSPIRVLKTIGKFINNLNNKYTEINLYFNEYKKRKFKELKDNCDKYLEENKELKKFVKINYSNKDFNDIFEEITIKTKNTPNLYILDQNGIKFINKEVFNILETLKITDFMFFISSSFLRRFGDTEEFTRYIDINLDNIIKNPYKFIHKDILDHYKSLIPKNSKLKLYPFSIKKDKNIYGIIFGSNHIFGAEKFLKVVWKENELNGEANFDIYDDKKRSVSKPLFSDPNLRTKIEIFQDELKEYLKNKKLVTNKDLYYFTIEKGHITKHTKKYLTQLKKLKKIKTLPNNMKGFYISWNNIKNNKIIKLEWCEDI